MILLALCTVWANDPEGKRLTEEIETLVKSSRWAGVERMYTAILTEHPTALSGEVHLVGAQAARQQGHYLAAVQRLHRIQELDASYTAAREELASLLESTGLVAIAAPPGTVFQRTTAPFAPDARAALAAAAEQVQRTGVFVGMLPSGTYTLGETTLELPAGPAWTVFTP